MLSPIILSPPIYPCYSVFIRVLNRNGRVFIEFLGNKFIYGMSQLSLLFIAAIAARCPSSGDVF